MGIDFSLDQGIKIVDKLGSISPPGMERLIRDEQHLFIVLANPCFSLQDILKLECCSQKLRSLLRSDSAHILWGLRAAQICCKVCLNRNTCAAKDFVSGGSGGPSLSKYYRGVCVRDEAGRKLRMKWGVQFASRALVNMALTNPVDILATDCLAQKIDFEEMKTESCQEQTVYKCKPYLKHAVRVNHSLRRGLLINTESLIDAFLVMEASVLLAGANHEVFLFALNNN